MLFLLLVLPFSPIYIYKCIEIVHSIYTLPAVLKVLYPVAWGTEGDLGQGCDVVVFKLSDATVSKIATHGINYLSSADSQNSRDNMNWQESPFIPIWNVDTSEDSPVRCEVINRMLLNKITAAVMQKGAYFSPKYIVIPTLGYMVYMAIY